MKHGRRVVAFEAQAWQDDPTKPIASAFGAFKHGHYTADAIAHRRLILELIKTARELALFDLNEK